MDSGKGMSGNVTFRSANVGVIQYRYLSALVRLPRDSGSFDSVLRRALRAPQHSAQDDSARVNTSFAATTVLQ